jgi:hypothetical protein
MIFAEHNDLNRNGRQHLRCCNPVLKGQPKIHEGREGSKGSALSSKFHLHDHP